MSAGIVGLGWPGGLSLELSELGASVLSLEVPDARGRRSSVVLGYDALSDYGSGQRYLASVVGRFANRIAGAAYPLDDERVALVPNEGRNQLHGGPQGIDQQTWRAEEIDSGSPAVRFTLASPHGADGHPGNVSIGVTYRLRDAWTLELDYTAETDRPTCLALTWHGHFHLGGGGGSVLDHELELAAERFLPVDAEQIPTGERRPVGGTAMDFRRAKPLGRDIGARDGQLEIGGGYDHCFDLGGLFPEPRPVARLFDPASGRGLELATTAPGVQLYTGNRLRVQTGRGGVPIAPRGGVCLETGGFPNAPNEPSFPSSRLDPGSPYRHTSVYRFFAEDVRGR